ncbi:MAG TPA: tetratricopeptide repeat protein, partial [Gemmataceae bacterium]|nr:tetratricopeptide repeat protein [Gemmataceae bacterium]
DGKIKAALAYTSTTHLGGGHEVAIYYYDNAIKAEFKTAQVYNNLGWSLAQRNLRTEAREFFTRAIQADPTLQVAYHNRLLLTVRQGADQGSDPQRWKATLHEGLADFDKAMQLGPVTADLYRNGARLCSLGVASDPTLAQRGLRYVARAIEHGILPKDLREDRLLTMGLGHLPRFWDLVDGPPSGRAHVLCRFTVDPLE